MMAQAFSKESSASRDVNDVVWSARGQALADRGDLTSAQAAFERAMSLNPHAKNALLLAQAYATAGEFTQARAVLAWLRAGENLLSSQHQREAQTLWTVIKERPHAQ